MGWFEPRYSTNTVRQTRLGGIDHLARVTARATTRSTDSWPSLDERIYGLPFCANRLRAEQPLFRACR